MIRSGSYILATTHNPLRAAVSSEGISRVDSEDLTKTSIKVQAEVHLNDQPDGSTTDSQVNSNGIEIDSVCSEDIVAFIPPSKQASDENTRATGSASGCSVVNSADKEKGNAFVTQLIVEETHSTQMLPQGSLERLTSTLLRRGDSQLVLQENWRRKASGTCIKNRENYISFHDIMYTVPQGWFFQKKCPKIILNNIRLVAT